MYIYRCDATALGQEQAHHRLLKDDAELLLCNHHYFSLKGSLDAGGWTREDVRRELVGVGDQL